GTSGMNDAGLGVGQSFSDPAGGLTITNMAMSNSGATIQVTYTAGSGDPTCIDGTPFTPPGPGVESCSTSAPTGAGGTSGRGGTTGTGGAAVSGTGGTTGRGGTTGQGGATASPVGTGGTTGAGGADVPNDRGVSGGCGCDTAGPGPGGLAATLLLLA